MSELAHNIFLTIFGVSLVLLIFCLIMRTGRPYVASEDKGIDVSAFTPTDILCAFLLIAYNSIILFSISPTQQATPLVFPKPAHLIMSQIIICLPAIAIYLRLSKPKLRSIMGLTRRPTLINLLIIPVVAVVCFNLIFSLNAFELFAKWLCELVQTKFEVQTIVQYLQKGSLGLKITLGLIAVVIAPIVEELIFRGCIYTVLKKYAGMIPALLFTSIFFSLIHNSVFAFFPLIILSMMLIWAYEKTKSLWTPIVMHMIFNATTVVTALFFTPPAV